MSRFAENSALLGRKSSIRIYVQDCLQMKGLHSGRRFPVPVRDYALSRRPQRVRSRLR
jgi:hypothetical protein